MDWQIRAVTAADTADLRLAVLRPGGVRTMPGDDEVSVLHVAAYSPAGELVGCGNVRPAAPPFPAVSGPAGWAPAGDGDLYTPGSPASWRLRGMATADGRRGQGVGAAVLAALVEAARAHDGRLLWCNARTPAQRFYERAGLHTWGEPWQDPAIGPHVVMWRSL